MRTDVLATCSKCARKFREVPLYLLESLGDETNLFVESVDRLRLERDSAFESRDSLFHRRIVLVSQETFWRLRNEEPIKLSCPRRNAGLLASALLQWRIDSSPLTANVPFPK